MVDREKVLKGLECCFGSIGKACPMECPYRVECLMQDDEYNMYSVMHDALKLLKEQQKQRFFVDSDGKITPLPIQKRGHWKQVEEGFTDMMCSECGELALLDLDRDFVLSKYCPNCGARMDEEVEQDDRT